jgi:hypothetical protein
VKLFIATLVVVRGLLVTGTAPAQLVSAQEMDTCPHEATIQALRTCVQHAAEHGHISQAGVAHGLLAKLDAAQAALDRGQPGVAINILQAAVREVDAQAGQFIDAEHAVHLRTHLQHVIAALAAA